jgi:predicted ATPase/class 3 adenylate cyclase/DNA-binding CsgD family transcriptional regulator
MSNLPTGTVTLLFTDIEGSTLLLQQLGERYAEMLATCRQLLRTAFLQWNGVEVDTQGDAFFVAFARASDAVAAAVAGQRVLFTHAWPADKLVRVRMGLHTGEPQHSAEGYVGLDVHHAARIMSAGHGGQVLLSQTTSDLVEHTLPEEVSLVDLGAHRLKDLQQKSQLFQLVIGGLPADFPPLKTLDSSPNNLPLQPTPFIGREKEVNTVQQLLLREEVHLVTLTGPGGVGKTRLALQVAAELSEHFADGTWFVSLAPISDPDLVIPVITQTLGLREAQDQSPLEQLKDSLHEKKMLLLVDNFEQVVSAAMPVADLLTVCPRLKVLVTSREVLHVRAEREFPVPALALPDAKHLPDPVMLSQYEAVALFIERAQAVKPDFQVTNTNAPAVAEICARLDGLPLAIELAAAGIKLFPPQALLARLTQRLPLLTRSARDVSARQQTLRKTIQWSYNLLTAQEQRLFRLLSVFAGSCSWPAVEAVAAGCGDDPTLVLDAVSSLIDKNLLQQTAQEGEDIRLAMLQTIRDYALECLEALGEMETARQAHAAYYYALVEEAVQVAKGFHLANLSREWLERLEREHDNLRATLSWSLEPVQAGPRLETALRLGEALVGFWWVRGFYSEGRAFLEQALARSEGVAASVRARALGAAADFAIIQGDFGRAEVLWQESLVLSRELGNTRGIVSSLQGLGWIAQRKGNNITEARSLLEESLAFCHEMGDKEDIAWSLANLADVVSTQGDYSTGRAQFEESLALFRELGHKRGMAFCLRQSALWLFLGAQGDQATVRARLEASLVIYRELGDKHGEAMYCWTAGWVALSQGDTATAHALFEESLVLWREIGDRWRATWALAGLGRAEAHQADFAAARAFHEESLARARAFNDYWLTPFCLEGLAGVVAAQGEYAWAARLWGVAESRRERSSIPLSPFERVDYELAVAAVRTHLGAEDFAAAWAEGRTMTPEQALAAQGPVTLPQPFPAAPTSTPQAQSPTTSPGGLSARELEVLRLLATGLTDAQIAEQLVLSLHTIHAHLRTIYSKLGVTSRSAATRYAFEHQLV